jgi:flagellar biosynthesis protein FliR
MTDALPIDQMLAAGLFVGVRIAGLMVFAPFVGSSSVPMPIKAALTLVLTVLLCPVYGPVRLQASLVAWSSLAASELLIGLILGLTVNFIFDGVEFAGQVIGLQMGFSLVNVIDPQTQVDTPVLSIFQQLVALLIFLQLNVHHWMLRALARSFVYLPPGRAWPTAHVARGLLQASGAIWLVGLQIAAPVVIATMLVDIALGFLSKASPQLPALLLGLSAKSLLGMAVLVATLSLWPSLLESRFSSAVMAAEHLLRLSK